MIDPKTIVEGIGAVARFKDLFFHDAPSAKAEGEPQGNERNAANDQVLRIGLTTEQLALLSIVIVACVAITAMAVVASQRNILQP